MFRKSIIALATVATLGAASLVPAVAGPMHGNDARQLQTTVRVYDTRNDRHDVRKDTRHDRAQQHRSYRKQARAAQQVCSVHKVRTVQWTNHGKVVRYVPKMECQYVTYRPR